jgi:acyl carrier protein
MNESEVRATVLGILARVAPEADLTALDPDVEWQDQLDLDSMNLLTMMVDIERATGISVPERDYTKVSTLNSCVAYLMSRTPVTQ